MARKFAIPSVAESVGSSRTVEKPETESVGPVNESTPTIRDLRTPCWVFCPYEKAIEKGNGMVTAHRKARCAIESKDSEALISHESMRRKDSEKFLDESAMVASDEAQVRGRTMERLGGSNSRGRSQSRGNHKKKCYYCDLEDHIMRNCQKLKADKEKAKPSDAAVIESFKGKWNGNSPSESTVSELTKAEGNMFGRIF
ncbi:hypothetical protein Acr_07g0015500 [Actinidia rufa]|uniref:CCHC-type domain-containing protein n=1 Tax=Actinidia rufa TaxID=165716 RepID=A0A7J0EY17_9ERIC|nr:hypothetical protein Acr_07g0015500 [Actinidia rufa]